MNRSIDPALVRLLTIAPVIMAATAIEIQAQTIAQKTGLALELRSLNQDET